jgi:hypothetical protein
MSWALGRYRRSPHPNSFFQTLFFLIPGDAVLSAVPAPGRGWSDGLLVFTRRVAAALQVPLVREYTQPGSERLRRRPLLSVAVGLLAGGDAQARLMETATGIGRVPHRRGAASLGVQVTSAFWAAEGVACCGSACAGSAGRPRSRLLVQLAAGIWFVLGIDELQRATPLLNDVFVGGMLIAGAGFIGAWLLREEGEVAPAALVTAPVLLWWGLAWWFGTGLSEIGEFAGRATRVPYSLFFATASAAALEGYGRGKRWNDLRWPPSCCCPPSPARF